MNGNTNVYASNNGRQLPENFIFQTVDPSQDDESDSDSGGVSSYGGEYQNATTVGLKPGKKTKGRVKIKMEFIDNKLRRYTTFSKRKTGLMKKAYELATLTGTQVMLLVASETGHVYTFATRKLQPMITSESGKALIQTCLNSPDPPPGATPGNGLEQRMNPSGFEETELTCTVGEEDQKTLEGAGGKPNYPSGTNVVVQQTPVSQQPQQQNRPLTLDQVVKSRKEAMTVPVRTKVTTSSNPVTLSSLSKTVTSNSSSTNNSISTMQFPVLLSQGGAISMLQTSDASVAQAISIPQITQSSSSTPSTVVKPSALSRVITALSEQPSAHSQNNSSGELNTPLPVSTPSINFMQNMTPGIVMYHTPQGVVYATPTQNLHDRTIFNFSQPPAAISMTQADQLSGQQFITIPVPMGGTSLMQLANPPTSNNNTATDTDKRNQPPNKKARK